MTKVEQIAITALKEIVASDPGPAYHIAKQALEAIGDELLDTTIEKVKDSLVKKDMRTCKVCYGTGRDLQDTDPAATCPACGAMVDGVQQPLIPPVKWKPAL